MRAVGRGGVRGGVMVGARHPGADKRAASASSGTGGTLRRVASRGRTPGRGTGRHRGLRCRQGWRRAASDAAATAARPAAAGSAAAATATTAAAAAEGRPLEGPRGRAAQARRARTGLQADHALARTDADTSGPRGCMWAPRYSRMGRGARSCVRQGCPRIQRPATCIRLLPCIPQAEHRSQGVRRCVEGAVAARLEGPAALPPPPSAGRRRGSWGLRGGSPEAPRRPLSGGRGPGRESKPD